MKKNEWASRFGARRKEIDRAILAEAERALEAEERKMDQAKWLETEMRQQLAFEAAMRDWLAQLTGLIQNPISGIGTED
jgi:hypothetical protein